MSSRVLLISINTHTDPYPVFPLGLACISAALKSAGHTVRWYDPLALESRLAEVLEEFQPDVVGVSLRNIDDVQISRQETFQEAAGRLCNDIRDLRNCTIVIGGCGFSIFPEEVMQNSGADYGIVGEGEESFLALLDALENGKEIPNIPGLVRRDGDALIIHPPQRLDVERQTIPHRPSEARPYYLESTGMLNVQTQRGCSLKCIYCTYPGIEGVEVRQRPAALVAAEFEQLAAEGVPYLFIVDSVFNSSTDHVRGICNALIERGSPIEWGCFLRPKGLSTDLFELMFRAGLRHVEFGSDSFTDSVLRRYGKDFTFNDILESTAAAEAAGVKHCHYLICGGPGETLATLESTYRNSLKLNETVIFGLIGMRVYPGTRLWQRLRSEPGWENRDLLQPQFYLSPELTQQQIEEALARFAKESPHWFVGEAPPGFDRITQRLRSRGVTGPLWEYLQVAARMRSQLPGVAAE